MHMLAREHRGPEAREHLAAVDCVPHVTVAEVFLDALDDVLDGVDLVRPHHQELLLAGDEDYVLADHVPERALGEKRVGAFDLRIVRGRVFVDG